ncbi:MAG: hypothetical protein DYG89_41410 [Caldilinea sp. CFX5]|nr:hypothetical protein [Caldilinea sp. CFX5]
MGRKLLVTVGVSLLREEIAEKEGAKVGFENLAESGTLNTLDKVQKQLRQEDKRKQQSATYPFNLDERQWVRARSKLAQAVAALWQGTANEKRKRLLSGAELASLKALHNNGQSKYALQATDQIILLASDTPSGAFCAALLKEVLEQAMIGLPKVASVQVKSIPGLRPDSVETFVAQGLPNAARLLNQYADNALLIGSGGYKGLLPYLGPVAMHLRIPLFYLYEESEELLELRPLPVQFDLALIQHYAETFNLIQPGQSIRTTAFWQSLQLEAGVDFNQAQHQIRDGGLLQEEETDTPGQTVIKLSATGVLSYLLAYKEALASGYVTPTALVSDGA